MAISRALITNKTDFIRNGYGSTEFNPDLFFNFEDQPSNFLLTRTPVDIAGVRGRAKHLNSAAHYRVKNVAHDAYKNEYSFWVKFDQAAFATDKWSILLTNRGTPSLSDHGFHLAMFNSAAEGTGQIIARIYKNGTQVENQQSHKMTTPFRAVPDTWYHVRFVYDSQSIGNKLRVYFNNTLVVWGSTDVGLGSFTRDLTIGQLSSTDANTYPAAFALDEFMYFKGSKVADYETYFTEYYNAIVSGKILDYSTEPGSIQLHKKFTDGTYITGSPVGWTSNIIDLGTPIDYYARLQVTADYDPNIHTVTVSTRSSDDGLSFSSWQNTSSDGTIYSPKRRYYQIQVSLMTGSNTTTPILKEMQLLEYEAPKQLSLKSEPLKVYKDLASGLEPIGTLHNAYDIWIEEEVKAQDILTFNLPMTDPKRKILGEEAVEFLIKLGNRRYIMKQNNDKKDSSGKKLSSFKAEAKWYELNDPKVIEYELVEADVVSHINKILSSSVPATTWKLALNVSTKTQKRTIRGSWKSVLALLRDVEDTFGVELYFDTENDEITVMDQIGKDNKVRFYYQKNMTEIERDIDTYGMVTRLYCYGAGELDLKTVNNGLEYIEDFTFVDKLGLRNRIRPDVWSDDRYTIPENLLEDGRAKLKEEAKPNVTYSMGLLDLSSRSGHEPESIGLGDTVYAIDEDLLSTELASRVMRRKYNVRQPQKTEVELEQPKKQLADAQSRAFDDNVQDLVESDPVLSSDIQEMTVFNHLLNSRADDGLAEWTQTGTAGVSATSEGGFSGENSFKLEANYDEFKGIYQEIYNLSHRSTYTISAMAYKEGNITAGASGFVGIRIKVTYKPDENGVVKEETKLLKIPDVTNM
jgi:phage minor structural protein